MAARQIEKLVPNFILARYGRGQYQGQVVAAALFVDISGFTPLTETLFRHRHDGAEILSETLEAIFDPIVRRVYAERGMVTFYAGDAFTALFFVEDGGSEDAAWRAWETAVFIHQFLVPQGQGRAFATLYGDFALTVGVGLALGEVQWGVPGRQGRYTFYFRGPAIDSCATAQHLAGPGEIVAHQSLMARLPERVGREKLVTDGYFRLLAPRQPLKSPAPLPPPADFPANHLPAFISLPILELPLAAEFRNVCPVFISFQPPADSRDLHDWVAGLLDLLHRYGGTFSQLDFGDKGALVVLYFGAPIGHENNVARAAEFLLALQKQSHTAVHWSQAGEKRPVRWRAGVTYGLVWAGFRGTSERREYGIIGDVVNMAARIALHAGWDEIWLDKDAALRLENGYQLEPLPPRVLNGKQAPRTLFRLLGVNTKFQVLYQGTMVGREGELEQMLKFVSVVFDGRFAGVVSIYGQAGIGKSRLTYELKQMLARWATWLECPADEILRQSLNPFRYCLGDYFRQSGGQEPAADKFNFDTILADLLTRLQSCPEPRAARLAAELQQRRSMLAALVDLYWDDSLYARLDPRLRFENTLTALSVFIRALSLLQPVVLHLEDTHWLDGDSHRLMLLLSRQLVDYPVAILCTSRYRDDGQQPKLSLAKGTPERVIALERLALIEIQTIAENLLQTPVDAQVVNLLAAKSDGIPFFAEQLTLDLHERQALILETGRYVLNTAVSLAVPQTLNALLIARLDRLPPPVKQVVQTAAVLGESFVVPVLAAMLKQDDRLSDKLKAAAARQVWAMVDELRYLFKHALLREAAYEMQLRARRRRLHHLAAKALGRLYQEDLSPHYGEIAHHYEVAYHQGLVELQGPACDYLGRAGRFAARRYENETALDYFERALKLTPVSDLAGQFGLRLERERVYGLQTKWQLQEEELAVLGSLAEALVNSEATAEVALRQAGFANAKNQYDRAGEHAQVVIELAQAHGDQVSEAAGFFQWGFALWQQGHYEPAEQQVRQALRLARLTGQSQVEAEALRILGHLARLGNRYDEAKRCFDQALGIVQATGDRFNESRTLHHLGRLAHVQDKYEQAQGYYEASIQIAHEIGSVQSELQTRNSYNGLFLAQSDYARSEGLYQETLELAKELGDEKMEGSLLRGLGLSYMGQSRYREAYEAHESARRLLAGLGHRREEGIALENLATLSLESGAYEQTLVYCEQALVIWREIGDTQGIPIARQNQALVYLAWGQFERARRLLAQALASYREIEDRWYESEALRGLGLVAQRMGQFEQAGDFYRQALAITADIGYQLGQGRVYANLALLAHQAGDQQLAYRHGQAALRLAEATAVPDLKGYTWTNLAHTLAALGQSEEARQYYRRAMNIRAEIALPHLAAESQAGLVRLTLEQGDLAPARAGALELLAFLESGFPAGVDDPVRLYLACAGGLQSSNGSAAREILNRGQALLQERAAAITDPTMRDCFLKQIPSHRTLLAQLPF